jgi:beta-glucosidase
MDVRKIGILVLFALFVFSPGIRAQQNAVDAQVEALLKKMTLKEKVGQMTQVTLSMVSMPRPKHSFVNTLNEQKLKKIIVDSCVGSILNTGGAANSAENWQDMITTIQKMATQKTRLGIPVIYGIDAIHGSNYIQEATLFPQSIAMAATFNRDLSFQEGVVTALETRAVGIPWNFNPVLGLGRQPLWSRFWETYGEDPYLVAELGKAYIYGLQGKDHNVARPDRVAACMKHYAGYSVPLSGHDRTPAWIPERIFREKFLFPFEEAVEAGVYTVMVNSGEVYGIPAHSSKFLLTDVLRNEWHFGGLVVSDWRDVINLYKRDHVAESEKDAVRLSVQAGLDMSMVPFNCSFAKDLMALVKEGVIPESRIDQSVRRILKVKYALGLFDNPFPRKADLKFIGTPENAQKSLDAAREVITLLKNKRSILPLKKSLKVLVTGPTANSRAYLNGGWSYTWQGDDEFYYPKKNKTILQAIQDKIGKKHVLYAPGATVTKLKKISSALKYANQSDVIVACLGEASYCETPGNINDLTLPGAQLELVKQLAETGKPIILVLVEGRPRIIRPIVNKVKAVLMAYLPGPYGPQAIADVLFGDTNPSGKLPFSYPKYVNDLMCYDYKYSEAYDLNRYDPQWPFGYGLSYTTFKYSDLQLDKKQIKADGTLNIHVTVTNSGKRAGKEAVLLFVSDLVRSVSPPTRQLKGFQKIELQPGESKTVRFTLDKKSLAFVNRENKWVVEPGTFKVTVGGLSRTFEVIE